MSWQTINGMLGLAMIDPKFANRLLANPLLAAEELGFALNKAEREALRTIKARDIAELSQVLLERFDGENRFNF